jgi:hypothetical protein
MSTSVRAENGSAAVTALASWRDGPAKQAILKFVAKTSGQDGSEPVPVEERVAVFDNDGTLWCEKPVPIQMDFILRRFVEMAETDAGLRNRQPWKAAYERDHGWFSTVMAEHYAGDDHNVKTLADGVLAAYAGVSVEDFEARADTFLHSAQHPTFCACSSSTTTPSASSTTPPARSRRSNKPTRTAGRSSASGTWTTVF